MHVLVTGGAGFIGSNLVDHLLANGDSVIVVDSFHPLYPRVVKERNLASATTKAEFTLVEGDIRDDRTWASLDQQRRPDAIVHLAALGGVRASLDNPVLYADVNVAGTIKVLEFARRAGVDRVVFASSSSVYGNDSASPFREDASALTPISPYGVTKRAGELLCHTFAHLYGLKIASLRIFTSYGPRQRPDLAIHKFARAMLDDNWIDVYGDGSMRRDFTYVGDTVTGISQAIEWTATGHGHEIFNLGGGQTISVSEIITLLEEVLSSKARVRHLPEQPGDVKSTWADTTKAQQALGYSAKTEMKAGLRAFVEWLQAERNPAL